MREQTRLSPAEAGREGVNMDEIELKPCPL